MFAACLSVATGDTTNGSIILVIVFGSGFLSFLQEHGAEGAVEQLLALIQVKATVLRDGSPVEIPSDQIARGDVVLLKAGDLVPADGLVLEENQLTTNEAALTGETFPAEKQVGVVSADAGIAQRTNSLFSGTYVASGAGKMLVTHTGRTTEFGQISESLRQSPPEGDFERGIRGFGYLLMEVTLILTICIFGINVYLHRPVIDSFMFALALAVGLTPQLLPAIVSVNLSHGARDMAKAKVIVKKLSAIENFGSMNLFCTDKTGTLTEGVVQCHAWLGLDGQTSERVHLLAFLNAKFQTGYANPIDQAILAGELDSSSYRRLQEIPYDFTRRRLSILLEGNGERILVTKGALADVLAVCTQTEGADGSKQPIGAVSAHIQSMFEDYSEKAFRTLGLAYKPVASDNVTLQDEGGMTFLGFLLFFDPLKEGVVDDLKQLAALGIRFKMITGDNRHVAAAVGKLAGMSAGRVVSGSDLRNLNQVALVHRVKHADIFAELDPSQKERVIRALKTAGYVVGYMGDGINDASAIHAADVGISVSNAVDVAREAADFVLLEKDLGVLHNGVISGRITFANTMKYVFMATSANFGNMFSMAGASLFLRFLPLLPKQILLGNMLTDFPEMSISTDAVDKELIASPQRWDINFVKRFMVVFGLANSACDYITFGILLFWMHSTPDQFRTGWFIENIVTAALIVLVIRTRHVFWKSRPSNALALMTLLVMALTVALPYSPLAHLLGLVPLPGWFLLSLLAILIFYVAVAETCKVLFYRKAARTRTRHAIIPS